MKRKLAVAVALVGGPSVVLLDEPSSGLDPGAQRNLWDLIKVTMKGRAVVLTTHSMGEADLLCDRVGIMVKGTMRCIGTPQELKERYAAGYEISCRLETRDDAHVADLVAFAREAFSSPDVDVAAADADIATLELAGVDPRRTPALAFRAFDDDACARLGVIDFSLARATMEKVFLRIAGGEEGLAQSRLGREIAEMLQAEADDEAQRELDAVVFSEATCCGCNKYAWKATCIYHFCGSGIMGLLLWAGLHANEMARHCSRINRQYWRDPNCEETPQGLWLRVLMGFYYAPHALEFFFYLMGFTWFWCAGCALWCLRTPASNPGGAVAPA